LTSGTNFTDDLIDTFLIDYPHPFGRNPQLDKAIFAFEPEAMVVHIGQKPATRFVVRVRYVVSANRAFAGDLTFSGHVNYPKNQ